MDCASPYITDNAACRPTCGYLPAVIAVFYGNTGSISSNAANKFSSGRNIRQRIAVFNCTSAFSCNAAYFIISSMYRSDCIAAADFTLILHLPHNTAYIHIPRHIALEGTIQNIIRFSIYSTHNAAYSVISTDFPCYIAVLDSCVSHIAE